MAHPDSRLRQFELQLADERRRQSFRAQRETADCGYAAPRRLRNSNTLGPQEDVIERRRHRNRVAMSHPHGGNSRNALRENIILLILLGFCIYTSYRLCIYILNL